MVESFSPGGEKRGCGEAYPSSQPLTEGRFPHILFLLLCGSHFFQLLLSSGVHEVQEGEGSLFAVTVPFAAAAAA